MPDTTPANIEIRHSTCPHDCPSSCALEVERLDANTIGRVRGGIGEHIYGWRDLRQSRRAMPNARTTRDRLMASVDGGQGRRGFAKNFKRVSWG